MDENYIKFLQLYQMTNYLCGFVIVNYSPSSRSHNSLYEWRYALLHIEQHLTLLSSFNDR